MTRRRLLDLFCGAGGSAMGYHRAGFDVLGVDHIVQPDYPFEFVKYDVFEYLKNVDIKEFSVIHASPPCQRYSKMANCQPRLQPYYPNHVSQTRKAVAALGVPYVIENVEEALLINPIMLCGRMFGLELYRHRMFESNVGLAPRRHPPHLKPTSKAGHHRPGTVMSVAGHVAPMSKACEAMGIDWMVRDQLVEAIPPAYTKYVGVQLLKAGVSS
jgi:DNA (cytosine-5)-methyltransferase 1